MTDLREAAQQALEAMLNFPDDISDDMFESITALKAALAEPVQEPVAWALHTGTRQGIKWNRKVEHGTPLYPAPPNCPNCASLERREPVQGPVAWYFEARHIDSAWAAAVTLKHPGAEGVYMRNVKPLYTAPPQRKPLTEEEIQAAWDSVDMRHPRGNETRIAFARAIERAHGIGDNT